MTATNPGEPSTDNTFDPSLDPQSFKRRSVRGGLWMGLARSGTHVVRLVAVLILARLLAPEDFGLLAMIVSAIGIANIFQDMGLSAATIQRKDLNEAQVSSLFWVNAGFGTALAIACALLAPAMAFFYQDERALNVTLALSASFFFNGLGTQPIALMQRMMQLADIAKLRVLATAASATIALAMAYHDSGYWALVAFTVSGDALTAALAWYYCRWRPSRPTFDRSTLEMLSFGGYMVGFAVLGFLSRNVHNIFIGRLYGVAEVGLFSRAYALMLVMQQYTSTAPGAVLLPALSRMHELPTRYRNYYLKGLRVTTLIAAPMALFTTVFATDVIQVLFGGQWARSADVMRWLAPTLLIQPVVYSSGWLFVSRGRPRDMMLWGLFGWTLTIICILAGTPFGLEGIAAGYSFSLLLLVVPCMAYAIRGTDIRLGDIFRAWVPGTTAAAIAVVAVYPLGGWAAEWPALLRVLACGTLFGLIYAALLLTVFGQRALIFDILAQLRTRELPSDQAP